MSDNFQWEEKDDDELLEMLDTLRTQLQRCGKAAYTDPRENIDETPIDAMDDVYRGHFYDVQTELIDRGLI